MRKGPKKSESPCVALGVDRKEVDDLENQYYWTGWKRHHWPADLVRPGFRLYAADLRPSRRQFVAVLEVTRGGSFAYRTKAEFRKRVEDLTGWWHRDEERHPQWAAIAKSGTGLAFRWTVVKRVQIPFPGKFEQIGWMKLVEEPTLRALQIDGADLYPEGNRYLAKHIKIERNSKLRNASKAYWTSKLGGLRCIVCNFEFGKVYEHGEGFIEMHHRRPLANAGPKQTRPSDLIPLCSNCHRMVHKNPKKVLSPKQLPGLLRYRH